MILATFTQDFHSHSVSLEYESRNNSSIPRNLLQKSSTWPVNTPKTFSLYI